MIARIGPKRPYRLFIRQRMQKKGLNQKQMAERLECAVSTVSKKLKNGGIHMNVEWLARFAYALDCEIEELFVDPDSPTRDELLAAGSADELRKAIELVRLSKTRLSA